MKYRKRWKRLVAPRCERCWKIRSDYTGGFDSQIGIVHAQQDILDWIISPCMGDEVAVRNVPSRQERHHPLQTAIPQLRAVMHRSFAQQMFKIDVAVRRMRRVRANEEGGSVVGDPIGELAGYAIERIEENQAAHARSDATSFEDRESRSKATAVGNDHDRYLGKREHSALIAIHSSKLDGRFIKKALEPVRLPGFARARIGGSDSKLRPPQHGVHARGRDLLRHLLPIAHILGEIGAVAMEEDDHHCGAFRIETWRNVQKHAVVTEGFSFPENLAAEIDVAPVALSTNI